MTRTSLYERVGGMPYFERLVARFYEGVAGDPPLRALYPEEELGPAQHRLTLFLAQYWGGPTTYSDNRGHPRLRMRHAPFRVTPDARDHWLVAFRAGLEEAALTPEQEQKFWDYITYAAQSMVNTLE
jgi:hemoglobin